MKKCPFIFLVSTFVLLCLMRAPTYASLDPDMTALVTPATSNLVCASDAECVVIPGICDGDWVAANKPGQLALASAIKRLRPLVECVGGGDNGTPPRASCIHQRCVLPNDDED